ncbi:hypothetical protein HHK36_023776 [Tetracentron sinense]|uniref:Gnk2-homologous domain-containing protein n=1 Tax=Tetracentron sinense TaxID=13715 RepID=A0A835D660_TETSI|nr:hypothetical protein HHK36_023776 [Tetracentron sinense]
MIWYDECFVRYSNTSFFSDLTVYPYFYMYNTQNVSEPDRFYKTLSVMLMDLANQTAFEPSIPMYATGQAIISDLQKEGGRVLGPSCNIRYEVYPFLTEDPKVAAPPPTNTIDLIDGYEGEDPADKVYGLFLCRGDVINSDACQNCIYDASKYIVNHCPGEKSAMNVSEPDRFYKTLSVMLMDLANQTAFEPSIPMYATGQAIISDLQKVYGLAQCTQDLSRHDCYNCLGYAIFTFPHAFYGKEGGRVLGPSCNIRYEVYPFLTEDPKVAAPPPTNTIDLIEKGYG